jgi:hypothetical protein
VHLSITCSSPRAHAMCSAPIPCNFPLFFHFQVFPAHEHAHALAQALSPARAQKAGEGQTCHFQSNMSRAAAAGAVSASPAADAYM